MTLSAHLIKFLVIASATCSIGAMNFAAAMALIWVLIFLRTCKFKQDIHPKILFGRYKELRQNSRTVRGTELIAGGLLALALGQYAGFLISDTYDIKGAWRVLIHLLSKHVFVFAALASFFMIRPTISKDSNANQKILCWLLTWQILYVIYIVTQRYTGVDWVHGLHSRLPPNRFDVGVYRISGLANHPLTFAYNAMIISFLYACAAMIESHIPLRRNLWILTCSAVLLSLLISGSRWPVLVCLVGLVFLAARTIYRYRRKAIFALSSILIVLIAEGSIIGRTISLFTSPVSFAEKFQRIGFWIAYLRMFADHPWFGIGFQSSTEEKLPYYFEIPNDDKLYIAHNIFIQTLGDSGLVGLVGLLLFLASMIVVARKYFHLAVVKTGIWTLAISIVLSGMMQDNLRDSEFLFAMHVFLAFLIGQQFQAELDGKNRKSPQDINSRTDPSDS